jgi:o-succinylbenzoate synthase
MACGWRVHPTLKRRVGLPLARARWWRYHIPFRTPFATAHGVLAQREGVLLELTSDAGVCGLGEIAPLPGFGGTLDRLWEMVPALAVRLLGAHGELGLDALHGHDSQERDSIPSALRCGIETALLDLAAQEAGCSLAALLGAQPATPVPVNATVGARETAAAVEQASRAMAAGFATIKLKVGLEVSVSAEAERVAAVRAAIGPFIRLRLDANEAWTPDEAIAVIRACAPYQPEWIEQPVPAADVTGLARVRRAVGTPIAADESVTGVEAVHALLAAEAADVIILKPMLAGGPQATLCLAALAREAGVGVVVTSMLETGIGIAAALQVAAAMPAPILVCGLATAGLLTDDLLLQPLSINNGVMPLPEAPGLGVQVDWARLARYAIAAGELATR